jgi:hypothetical protein
VPRPTWVAHHLNLLGSGRGMGQPEATHRSLGHIYCALTTTVIKTTLVPPTMLSLARFMASLNGLP